MLHTYQPAPFSSPTRQHQFEAVVGALRAEAGAPYTVVLGNVAPDPTRPDYRLDAVVIRPRSITLLQLLPAGGLLHIPDLRTGTWLLDGAPLEMPDEAENPYARFEQQRAALAAWLTPHLPPDAANLQFTTGLVLFSAPVRFGPEVEARMGAVPAASTFHLLPDPARFTRRLAQLATPEIDLTPSDLEQLTQSLGFGPADEVANSPTPPTQTQPVEPASAGNLLRQKAGQLWRWLGAEDVDELDRRSTGYEVDLEARNQEKEELEQLRTTLQADLSQQLRAMESRETEREQRIAQLQQQLAAAPIAPEAPDLQAQLAAEKREKAALEASIQNYRTELESRNQELGSKIQQLENLIQRLSAAPVVPPLGSTAIPPVLPPKPAATEAAPPPPAPSATRMEPPSPRREQFGRPAEARQQLLAGLERWRPAVRRLTSRLGPWARQVRQHPRWAAYAAGGGAALLLALGIARCNSTSAPVPFQHQGRYGLLDSDGDTLLPARYAHIGEFREHRAVVEQDGVFGVVQDDGQEVVKPAYDALYPYAGAYARVKVGQYYTFIDAAGEEFGAYYYAARDFSEGYAAVLDHRGWHYITGPDEPATTPVIFQEAYSFDKELARIKTKGYFTFIQSDYLADTTSGTAPFGRYSNATDFDAQGRARVTQQGRTFFIDRDGDEVKE
ncbi:WG repeat-containing protein [Hymenobacter sp. HSC-4F20]|uniref:WG repeat-containing protein n=1 Tax=Hymenobacter sp. HSC-4F20 TaxID=2864135 RepID=UPI001C7360DC|nr:WG repeat-containing protein [Hymenobacter sp. HSC-4F20]MBX0291525.1 WG repeat-containing protein [Hymenobacter sp. HSC-4F20]